jgi:hypothetical protein
MSTTKHVAKHPTGPATKPATKPTKRASSRKTASGRTAAPKTKAGAATKRTFDARPDTVDFRDRMYEPTLVEVPSELPLAAYLKLKVPVLDQGQEGACTGFGLATVANGLLRRRAVKPDRSAVSARMLYEMARRYDEWEGEDYDGSSARGAMKGWYKHGVCGDKAWPYVNGTQRGAGLTSQRSADAARRPLGAYLRVNHRDLVAMHAALAEVGVLYATATVHAGWNAVGADGIIQHDPKPLGGHAFAIVAYDGNGFWIQNSWGTGWGRKGFARIGYDDWLRNGTDVWVARLGVPLAGLIGVGAASAADAHAGAAGSVDQATLRPHVINVGIDGQLRERGDFGMSVADLQHLFRHDVRQALAGWSQRRLVLHAHGGLVPEQAALGRLAAYRPVLMAQQAYPLGFVWHSDYWTTLSQLLQEVVRRRRPEGALDRAKDFLLDRLDDGLEPLARMLTGKASWDEMKKNALGASQPGHAAALVADEIRRLHAEFPDLQVHLTAHSAGAVMHAPLVSLLTAPADGAVPVPVDTCTLWAPACTHALFDQHYAPALQSGLLRRAVLYLLDDKTERDDHCGHIYNKSLLYLVSNAFEARLRSWGEKDGEAILGLQKFAARGQVGNLIGNGRLELVVAPNTATGKAASTAKAHGDFDDDDATVQGSFERIVGTLVPVQAGQAVAGASRAGGRRPVAAAAAVAAAAPGAGAGAAIDAPLCFARSQASLQSQRQSLDGRTRSG